MNVLITGGTGFVGMAVLEKLLCHSMSNSYNIRTLGRQPVKIEGVDSFHGVIDGSAHYQSALENVDVVIHIAAIAHNKVKKGSDCSNPYKNVNTMGTINLAHQAAEAGVKRFIFISSINVNGGQTKKIVFKHDDKPEPSDECAQSKYEAELGLSILSKETGMEIVIIRPPLVYGANAPGNFGKLAQAVISERWLPLGEINNSRSFVAIDNLVDLIMTCIVHPKAANQIFLVSDDVDISTTELLHKMAFAFGKKVRLIPIPMKWIRFIAGLLRKSAVAERLCGSLQVDITHTKETLDWRPPVTMEQQLAKIAVSIAQASQDK